ncbi:NTP transferase domain-containing protein [Marinoscillum sp. MHG1-6]|uniref:nucleotidyltransferase family protein n=1 Tax=Marinoscillum sp. MHG1-6 TaxID=2959627 RepID=UPI0021583B09|nr:nucleotidyltransferase family protein [Marinoscillum sp. MHG1-6]
MHNRDYSIAIVILAAGASHRMGTIKQLLPFGDSTLLNETVKICRSTKTDHLLCVLGAHADEIAQSLDPKINLVINHDWGEGLGSSIRSGINQLLNQEIDVDAVLLMLGDQPEVSTSLLTNIIDAGRNSGNRIVATQYDEALGVPALFPKKYFSQLTQLNGDIGAKRLINDPSSQAIQIIPEQPITDIDTMEEYENFIQSDLSNTS